VSPPDAGDAFPQPAYTRAFLISELLRLLNTRYAASPQLQESDVTIIRVEGLPNWTAVVPKAKPEHLENALLTLRRYRLGPEPQE
jgi:hypothetical protein